MIILLLYYYYLTLSTTSFKECQRYFRANCGEGVSKFLEDAKQFLKHIYKFFSRGCADRCRPEVKL